MIIYSRTSNFSPFEDIKYMNPNVKCDIIFFFNVPDRFLLIVLKSTKHLNIQFKCFFLTIEGWNAEQATANVGEIDKLLFNYIFGDSKAEGEN